VTKFADPVKKARGVRFSKPEARRVYTDIEAELALADHGPDWEGQAEQALSDIRERFPGVEHFDENTPGIDPTDVTPRSLSRKAQRTTDNDPSSKSSPPRRASGGGRHTASSGGRRRRSRGFGQGLGLGLGAGRAWKQTGIPGAADTTSGLGLRLLGIGFGLALAYLLVNERGAGPKALQTILDGIGTTTRLFLSPVDPLAPGTLAAFAAAPSKAPAPGRAVRPAGARPRRIPGVGAAVGATGRSQIPVIGPVAGSLVPRTTRPSGSGTAVHPQTGRP
jgi:hypothetical protein